VQTVTPQTFIICAVPVPPGWTYEHLIWQQWLYQQAFAIAQEVVRPSLPERDLLAVWN
jgi:hypothetical protein